MKSNTDMDMMQKLAGLRVTDLDHLVTPEEMMELGVELVLVGSERKERQKRQKNRQ